MQLHYLKYSIKVLENDFVTFDELNNCDIVNVYIPFVNINNFLIDQFIWVNNLGETINHLVDDAYVLTDRECLYQ